MSNQYKLLYPLLYRILPSMKCQRQLSDGVFGWGATGYAEVNENKYPVIAFGPAGGGSLPHAYRCEFWTCFEYALSLMTAGYLPTIIIESNDIDEINENIETYVKDIIFEMLKENYIIVFGIIAVTNNEVFSPLSNRARAVEYEVKISDDQGNVYTDKGNYPLALLMTYINNMTDVTIAVTNIEKLSSNENISNIVMYLAKPDILLADIKLIRMEN